MIEEEESSKVAELKNILVRGGGKSMGERGKKVTRKKSFREDIEGEEGPAAPEKTSRPATSSEEGGRGKLREKVFSRELQPEGCQVAAREREVNLVTERVKLSMGKGKKN